MLHFLTQKLLLYSGCAIPSIIFFLLTKNQNIKHVNSSPPDWLLILIGFSEVFIPIAYNAYGSVLDRVIVAVMAVVMTSGMFIYIHNRHQTPEGEEIHPFYEILANWNQSATKAVESVTEKKDKKDETSLSQIRLDAFKFLLRAIAYTIIYIPVFSTMDGFVRTCQEPPEVFTNSPYLYRLFKAPIPLASIMYYIWLGITFTLHIALIPLVHLLTHAIQLNIIAWMPTVNHKILRRLHRELANFVAQPPLFNKPWLTRSVYDLWSRRWHQIFRPGFHQIAYNPIRRLFGKEHKVLGRLIGTIAVFACSGAMHDYIMLVMLGYSNWKAPGMLGYQTLFFFLQSLATIVSAISPKLPSWLARTLTWLWVLYTAPFFVEPYIRIGLHKYVQVPGFPKFMDEPIRAICPYGPREFLQ
ncbi:membrane bound O-acyl transferase family-domain-containing protein [Cokeromyces recurvatus]|uniref:membrane bound O-acyl transferase family-domain-containing protein n=1 Tax=Cokeromyces recurvatus TaxID=90255 RepID=UPI0022207EE4|nr:membrane bound O-acyl transferase family-domain-containing protein [Cokeromyces recurvatus]KAI7899436.1 membrane bound O-acyl transferase family-domain-containing protein [Cokeromyces recurvatus]